MQYNGHELVEVTEPQVFNPPKEMLVWDECDEGEILKGKYELKRVKVYGIIATTGARVVALFNGDLVHFEKCAEIPEEPKPRRATNRELAKWLSQGNGEFTIVSDKNQLWSTSFFGGRGYERDHEDEPVDGKIRVRKWDDTEWHEPTVDYIGLEG